jgi:hypothetical protein
VIKKGGNMGRVVVAHGRLSKIYAIEISVIAAYMICQSQEYFSQ